MANINRDVFRNFIGYDSIFDHFDRILNESSKAMPSWPPYNVRRLSDDKYAIEMAVAGFGKSDVELTLNGNQLEVSGKVESNEDNYIFKGIANRSFKRTFTLADSVVVKNADLVNGMLKIFLDHATSYQSKKIPIGESETNDKKQLLTE